MEGGGEDPKRLHGGWEWRWVENSIGELGGVMQDEKGHGAGC